jgi:hypothetical protein
MKNMNPKMVRLLHEGFSISTLENLSNNQLDSLYRRICEQSTGTLNIPKTDTESIAKAKSEKKPFVTYEEEVGEMEMTEKAVSRKQQRAMAMALKAKQGEMPKSKLKGSSKEMFKMSEKDLEDFASTKHKGLPNEVREDNDVKKLEESIMKIIENHLPPHTTKGELLRTIKSIKR